MSNSMKYPSSVVPASTPILPITPASAATVEPISVLAPPQEQHMLLLFLPLKKGILANPQVNELAVNLVNAVAPVDNRAATGVHFAMFHLVPDGTASALPVPTFQAPAGKDLLVAQSLYDAPFDPYISAFTTDPAIATGLDGLLSILDETGIPIADPATSAAQILANGGVFQNSEAFIALLMRYNFGDPTIPAATSTENIANPAPPPQRYVLFATFPGLTVGSILQNYPDAQALWPSDAQPITFQ
ncbi:MAG TPA: hypothetical protein VEO54_31495 [Thermoanaerobaculia bacterium]|nr:hypothetical protein [Thermoanaerobaculia bacterium]